MGISKNIRTIEDKAPARKSAPESTHESRGAVRQRTLKTSIDCSGIGLHSGAKVSMTLNPADANTGIRFKRTDIAGGGAVIPARWDYVVDTRMSTTLGNEDGITIGTVEHLMAALAGCGIDNALVEKAVAGRQAAKGAWRGLSGFGD